MQNRRDQVQAHRFVVSRLTTGLLREDPDTPEPPTRRTYKAVTVGAALAAVLCVGALVFGLISPGGANGWRDGHTLVVEKGTGTRYLFDGERLRPVRNYASARLLVGEGLKTDTVSTASLRGTPHGDPVGIEGAPDYLPTGGSLGSGPWQVCVGTRPDDTGGSRTTTTLLVDSGPAGRTVPADDGALVRGEDGELFLLWHGNRFRLPGGQATATGLGYGAVNPLLVSAAFLDALPAGPDLAPPQVAGEGAAGPELDGAATRVGQVFAVRTLGSVQQYYLLLRSGLTPVTTTQAALILGAHTTRERSYEGKVPQAIALSSDALDGALAPEGSPGGPGRVERAGAALPPAPPEIMRTGGDEDLCVRLTSYGDTGTGIALMTTASSVVDAGAVPPPQALTAACLVVDAVSVPPSGGSLVRALGSAGSDMGDTTYLVTDTGRKYRVPSQKAAAALGYDLSRAQKLPSTLLDMLPTGPDLSPESAQSGREAVTGVSRCGEGRKNA